MDAAQLGTAAALGCSALCAARHCATAVPAGPEPLVSEPSHHHPQFPGLPTLEHAQRSAVVRVPGFLSTADIEAIHKAAKQEDGAASQLGTEVRRWDGSAKRWTVTFLHTNGHLLKALPDLAARMEQLVREVDAKHWRLLEHPAPNWAGEDPIRNADGGAVLGLRCCEYHRMMKGGHLGDVHHHDEGSIITLDIMLTPRASYEGGELSTLEWVEEGEEGGGGSDDSSDKTTEALQQHAFEQGDALLFVSHKYHCVAPVTEGLRQVLVAEYWWGEHRECGHRCDQHWGRCEWTPGREQMDMFFDELVGATEGGVDIMAAAAAAADDDSESESESEAAGGVAAPSTPPRRTNTAQGSNTTVFSTPGGSEAGITTADGTRYTNVD